MESGSQKTVEEWDIERCRNEAEWQRAIKLAKKLRKNKNSSERYVNFVIGESKLEIFLKANLPIKANISKAQHGLIKAKKYLELALDVDVIDDDDVTFYTKVRLAKLLFACGNYKKSYEIISRAKLTEQYPSPRNLQILAESYAIKGLCLENLGNKDDSELKQAERSTEMTECFRRVANFTGRYSKNRKKGYILKTASERAPGASNQVTDLESSTTHSIADVKMLNCNAHFEQYSLGHMRINCKRTQFEIKNRCLHVHADEDVDPIMLHNLVRDMKYDTKKTWPNKKSHIFEFVHQGSKYRIKFHDKENANTFCTSVNACYVPDYSAKDMFENESHNDLESSSVVLNSTPEDVPNEPNSQSLLIREMMNEATTALQQALQQAIQQTMTNLLEGITRVLEQPRRIPRYG